jgi:hypothetical protein
VSRRRVSTRAADRAEAEALAAELAEDHGLEPTAARELAKLALAPLRLVAAAWDALAEASRPKRPPTA